MKRTALFSVLALPLLGSDPCLGEVLRATGVEVLLTRLSADAAGIGALRDGLEVTPARFVLIGDQTHMYAVAWGGVGRVEGLPPLRSYAYTPDGLLMGIQGRDLVYFDAAGAPNKLFELPAANMAIAAGRTERMFLFGHDPAGRNGLYELLPGKRIRKLLVSPEPIHAVAEAADGTVIFSAGRIVYSIAPAARMRVLAVVPGSESISSLALDPESGRIYLSDGEATFAVEGRQALLVSREAGGVLRWLDGGLVVLDPRRSLLVRLTGLSKTAENAARATARQ